MYVITEVLMAVIVKITILWNVIPCNPLKSCRSYGCTYFFHF